MKLKNILIVVKDIEKSKRFYRDMFGLEVLLDRESNVVLTEVSPSRNGKLGTLCGREGHFSESSICAIF